MLQNHIICRGSYYHYVCRVPHDLVHFFPKPVIWQSLKTSNLKHARLLAASWEFKTQQLFMQIRSGMLDRHLIDHLIALYLGAGVTKLEAKAYDRAYEPGDIETILDCKPIFDTSIFGHSGHPDHSSLIASRMPERIKSKSTSLIEPWLQQLVTVAKDKYGVKLCGAEKKELGLRLLQIERQLHETDSAVGNGDLTSLELLQEKVQRSKSYFGLKTLISKYQEWYGTAKPDVKPGTRDDMLVECATLLEIFGNISIDSFNDIDSTTELRKILLKYPKNRVQRFGNPSKRSIKSIIKNESDYEVIAHKTANEYIKRAKALVDYAIKADMLDKANKWDKETFSIETAEEAKRRPYDDEDIKRLVDALCTKSLWHYNPPTPERFWIVLIALFHGLRLSNITGLTKSDVILMHNDIWVFRIRFGKRKATVKDYPIHDCLLLLGFLEWVEHLDRQRLFQDSSRQISSWWNRVDKDKQGNIKHSGFEHTHITQDPTKCLYSLRHYYAGEVYDASQDYKATAEALGHSLSGKVTNGYIGKIRLKTHKELIDKLKFDVDLDRLEEKAQELFSVKHAAMNCEVVPSLKLVGVQ